MEKLKQNFKIFNYRPLVLVFVGCILGVLFNVFIKKYTILVSIFALITIGIVVFYSILHKKIKYFIILGICFLLGYGCYGLFINSHKYTTPNLINSKIEATITSINNRENNLELILEDVKVDDKKVEYNVIACYYNIYELGYETLERGDIVNLIVYKQYEVAYFNENGIPYTYYTNNNIGASISTSELEVIGHKNIIRYTLLQRIRNNLRLGLNNQNGEMIYSAMFGDKSNLTNDLYDSYKLAGVAHLLAVSGLHVGLVVSIIYWILKKLHIKNWGRVLIVATLLFCYAYLCNFSYSILRASIMALVLIISSLFYSEYDLLSSISLAGTIILFMEPTALFDVGALLSFGCVIGIAMLYPIIKKYLKYIPIKEWIIDAFSISSATLISTLFIMDYYFQGVQVISLISNILIIPIFSILFTISFIITIISLIIPFASYLLFFVNPLLEYLNLFIILIARIPNIIVFPKVSYLYIILSFVLMSILSKYNLKKGNTKLIMSSTSLLAFSVCFAMGS